jgi:hypothetical protein
MTALPSESGGNRAVGAIRVVAAVATFWHFPHSPI